VTGNKDERPLVFYYIGSWDESERKNVGALVQAYLSCGWTAADPVELVLQLTPPPGDIEQRESHGKLIQMWFERVANSLEDKAAAPVIRPLIRNAPYEDIWQLHVDCDVFVTASRGEGWCLPAAHALASGNDVIAPGTTLAHFADCTNVALSETRAVNLPPMSIPGYETDQTWWDVDVHDMKHDFIAVLKDAQRGERSDDGTALRALWSPQVVGEEHLLDRFTAIQKELERRDW